MLKRARALLEKRGFDIIQRMQADRGSEFFAYAVQEQLIEYAITFRSIRPGAPQLNGKVERSQKTDKIEFYAMQNLDDTELDDRLAEWQFHYNWRRPHGALGGKTPMEVACELLESTPLWDDVHALYHPAKERNQVAPTGSRAPWRCRCWPPTCIGWVNCCASASASDDDARPERLNPVMVPPRPARRETGTGGHARPPEIRADRCLSRRWRLGRTSNATAAADSRA